MQSILGEELVALPTRGSAASTVPRKMPVLSKLFLCHVKSGSLEIRARMIPVNISQGHFRCGICRSKQLLSGNANANAFSR